jgi:hypothetical protein
MLSPERSPEQNFDRNTISDLSNQPFQAINLHTNTMLHRVDAEGWNEHM